MIFCRSKRLAMVQIQAIVIYRRSKTSRCLQIGLPV
jgi:hypothetical protein